jgi:glycosyltransferase involved in cell wall biosynthesis
MMAATGMPPDRFTVVIPARNEAEMIAETISALRSCREIDAVVVVDDGSDDRTAELAEAAGATVMRHPRSRGKGAALMTGAGAVLEDERERLVPPRGLIFLDADVGEFAGGIRALAEPILEDRLDLAMAIYSARGSAGGHGLVVRLAQRAIEQRTGWRPELPLSGIRAMTLAAYRAVLPLAPGWGVETAMTIDAIEAGLRVGEVPTSLTHRATGTNWRAQLHRARQYLDVRRALAQRS